MFSYLKKRFKIYNDNYFKLNLLFSILLYFFFLFFLSLILNLEYYKIWRLFGVPAREILFSDIYPFFVDGICKVKSSNLYDYYEQFKNCDGWKREYNYMPIWLNFLKLGVSKSYHYYIGFFSCFVFLICLFKIFKINSKEHFYIYFFSIISPTTMLALERGNTDLLIFALVFLFIILCKSNKVYKNFFGYLSILFGSLIKFFPFFLIFIFFKKNFFNRFYIIFIFLFFTLYIIVIFPDMLVIKRSTPETFFLSYGYNVFEVGVDNLFYKLKLIFLASKNYLFTDYNSFKDGVSEILFINDFKNKHFIFSRLLVFLLIIFFVIKFFAFPNLREKNLDNNNNYLFFIAGSTIFCGTFLFGANFDYRLIFLLFTIPYLLDLRKSKKKFLNIKNKNFIYLILLYFWISPITIFTSGLDEIMSWFIFIWFLNFLSSYYLNIFFNLKKN